jgi:uncharacterized FAD-dependent dehydrogenase
MPREEKPKIEIQNNFESMKGKKVPAFSTISFRKVIIKGRCARDWLCMVCEKAGVYCATAKRAT